jgi:hypothetical protein
MLRLSNNEILERFRWRRFWEGIFPYQIVKFAVLQACQEEQVSMTVHLVPWISTAPKMNIQMRPAPVHLEVLDDFEKNQEAVS